MGLTDKIEGAIEDFKKRNNDPKTWEILKKKLKKKGFNYESEYYNHKDLVIEGISSVGADKFLRVWEVINDHLNKKDYKWYNDDGRAIKTSFEVIKKASTIEDVEEIIKTLAETGYEIPLSYSKAIMNEESFNLINSLAKDGTYKDYSSVFRAMKKIGYEDIKSYDTSSIMQLDFLIRIASLKKEAIGAIYVLASNGYQIDKIGGINTRDLKNIENIVEEDKKEKSEGKGGIPIHLYKEGNVEIFQEYFNSLGIDNQKSILKSILDYETKTESEGSNNRKLNREWLEKDYKDLLREIGFEE